MRRASSFAAFALASGLALTACQAGGAGEQTREQPPSPSAGQQRQMQQEKEAEGQQRMAQRQRQNQRNNEHGVYAMFKASIVGNGEPSVLFFHAEWCPYCQKNHELLRSIYRENPPDTPVYRVDYDTATQLKQRFGVVQQDTFVKIDAQGNKVDMISFPDPDELRAFLQG